MVKDKKGSESGHSISDSKTKKLKLCAYIRVSDEKQTVENQKLAIIKYVENHENMEIIDWYPDEGVSAFKERPKFNKMKEMIPLHIYDAVIAYKLDRVGRSVIDLHNTVDFLQKNNCGIIFVADSIDTTTPQGRLFFNIQASFAEFEAEMIRERTKLGLARVKASGSKSGKPIGRPRIKINDADILKIYNEGKGIQKVANELGMRKSTVYYRLKKLGIKLRDNPYLKKYDKKEEN